MLLCRSVYKLHVLFLSWLDCSYYHMYATRKKSTGYGISRKSKSILANNLVWSLLFISYSIQVIWNYILDTANTTAIKSV